MPNFMKIRPVTAELLHAGGHENANSRFFFNRHVIKLERDCLIMAELINILASAGPILSLGGQLRRLGFICKHISKSLLGLYSKQT